MTLAQPRSSSQHDLREEICRVGASLFARGYVHATAGNISVRLEESQGGGFLITPTNACLGRLDPARLAHVDADGQQTGGDRASKTLALHCRIYDAARRFDPSTCCVIHTHSTHCVALTLWPMSGLGGIEQTSAELLPALTPYFVMKVGRVPVIPYHRPGAPQAAELVASAIAAYGERGIPIRAVVLERLGPNVWHDSPASAMAILEELEETARLWQIGMHLNQPQPAPLDKVAIAELRSVFGARW